MASLVADYSSSSEDGGEDDTTERWVNKSTSLDITQAAWSIFPGALALYFVNGFGSSGVASVYRSVRKFIYKRQGIPLFSNKKCCMISILVQWK